MLREVAGQNHVHVSDEHRRKRGLDLDRPGLNPHSSTYQLCDLGQVFNLFELQHSYLQNGK